MKISTDELKDLPGSELVLRGLEDLKSGITSEFTLLVQIASIRLGALGLEISLKDAKQESEILLYDLLSQKYGNQSYSLFNSYIRKLISFTQALTLLRKNLRLNSDQL